MSFWSKSWMFSYHIETLTHAFILLGFCSQLKSHHPSTLDRQKISNKKWDYSRVRKKENFKLEEKWSRKMVPTDSYIFGALPSLFQHLAFHSFPFFFVHHRSHHDWFQRPSPYREFHSERSRSSFLNTIYGHNKRCYNCENRIANSKN